MIEDPSRRFIFRLALALGGMTVEELLRRISSSEISAWQAFDRLEPLPDPNYSAGLIAASIHNAMGTRKKPWSPADFMPVKSKRKAVNPAQKSRAIFAALMFAQRV